MTAREIEWHGDSIAAGRRNEDRLRVVEHAACTVAILADGAGGTGDGEAAAETAIEYCARAAELAPPASAQACVELLIEADQAVLSGTAGGETTLIFAVVANGLVYGASVGNSIAWIVPDAQDPVDLTQHQRRRPFAGSGGATPVAFAPAPLDGSLILASDGLHDYLPYGHFVTSVQSRPPIDAVSMTFAALRERHRDIPDDASLLVLRPRVP